MSDDGKPDWVLYYVPGEKAYAEYKKFTGEKIALSNKPIDTEEREHPEGSTPAQTTVASESAKLVKHFYKCFHSVENAIPNAKALVQASKLIAEYGFEKALFIVDFSCQAARETHYKLELFGGVLEYTPRAIGVYEQLKRRETTYLAEERLKRLQEQYEEYRRQAVVQYRETMVSEELEGIEATVKQQLAAKGKTPHVAMNMMVRLHTDALLEERAGILSFESWERDQQSLESIMADVRHQAHSVGACYEETNGV